jgi:hypothetical protein
VDALDPETQRQLGIDLFNSTWTLLEKADRSTDEDDEMVHGAHASAYHWRQVGTAVHRARSEWQCSRVYAVLGRVEPALHHAHRCLEIVDAHPAEMEDWDRPAALEAVARAHWIAGDLEEARRHAQLGRELAAAIADEHDRVHIDADFREFGV